MNETRDRLVASLHPSLNPSTLEPRDQARAALTSILDLPVQTVEKTTPNPLLCPNCDAPTANSKSPYCSEACREEAGFVRQMRTGLRKGWILDEEKQLALGQVLWHILGGGRPYRQSIIPDSSKKRALMRAEGICQVCGAPATTFDHEGSGCNRDINLRVVCGACSTTVPLGDSAFLEKALPQRQKLADRIGAVEPLRFCDDAEAWDWRAYLRERVRSTSG